MAHSYSNLLTHVIFSTKGRARLIDAQIKNDLFAYIGGIVREIGGSALLVNGTEDHVHMLLRLPAKVSLAECVRIVKANSSRWVHEKWPDHKDFGWQIGYGAFAVSASNVAEVESYIRSQPEHHRNISFRDEFVAFLRKNGVEFDQRFVVD